MSKSLVLVVGQPACGQNEILTQLTQSTEANEENPAVPSGWLIDSKYYTCEVKLQRWTLKDGEETSSEAFDGCASEPEALLLVFDRSKEASFDALTKWVATNHTAVENIEVRLCVANNLTSTESWSATETTSRWSQEGVMSRCWEWCLQEGFEPIETFSHNPDSDQVLATSRDEPQGVQRVRDALQAHMWPDLVRKEPSAVSLLTEGGAEHTNSDTNGTDEASLSLFSGMEVTQDPGHLLLQEDPPMPTTYEIHMDDTEGGDEFEELMKQMMNMRAAGDGETLSDEDRRKRAEDFALKFAALSSLQDEGLGTDSEDDE